MTIGSVFTSYLNLILGTIFVFIIGFFIMQIVLAAISLATGFDSSKKSYEAATKQLTAAIKGLALSLGTFFLLNTILQVLNITAPTETITTELGNQFESLIKCLRNFRGCNP